MTLPSRVVTMGEPNGAAGCVGYTRVSTDKQAADDKTSLADQRAAITALASRLAHRVDAWFEDDGYSGATVEKRPAFQRLLAHCAAHPRPAKDGRVLVLNDSRFGRFDDPEEATHWRFALKRLGWIVRFCEGDDGEEGIGRSVMRLVGAGQASEYRKNVIANARRGAKAATERGFWKGGSVPFGYLRQVVAPAGRERRILPHGVRKAVDEHVKLVINDVEAVVVRRLFEAYATGTMGLMGLAALARREWPRNWTTSSVYRLLANPVYAGDLMSRGRAKLATPYGMRDAHPAIIDRALFAAVQDRMATNSRLGRAIKGEYILSGVVMCAACGMPLVGSGTNGRRSAKYYRCRGSFDLATKACKTGGACVAAPQLEDAVRRLLAAEFRRPAAREATRRAIDAVLAARVGADVLPSPTALDRRVRQIETQITRVVAAIGNGTLLDAEAAPQLATLRAALTTAQVDRAGIVSLADRAAVVAVDRQAIDRIVNSLPSLLYELEGAEARAAMVPWIRGARFERFLDADGRPQRRLQVEIRRVPAVAGLVGGLSSTARATPGV